MCINRGTRLTSFTHGINYIMYDKYTARDPQRVKIFANEVSSSSEIIAPMSLRVYIRIRNYIYM